MLSFRYHICPAEETNGKVKWNNTLGRNTKKKNKVSKISVFPSWLSESNRNMLKKHLNNPTQSKNE